MMDLTRHVLIDSNNWFMTDVANGDRVKFNFDGCKYRIERVEGTPGECADIGRGPLQVTEENALGVSAPMYNPDGSYSFYGIWFTLVATWTGFLMMFIGILWYTDLPHKLSLQWRQVFGDRSSNREPLLP